MREAGQRLPSFRAALNELRLVVYHIIYDGFDTFKAGGWLGIGFLKHQRRIIGNHHWSIVGIIFILIPVDVSEIPFPSTVLGCF